MYKPENCSAAYQLDWSYSLFWHQAPDQGNWWDELKTLCEPDGIRLLQHEFQRNNVSQFLVSTQPHVPPVQVAQRIKGRLQHLLRTTMPNAFRRNYSLRSIGSTRRETLDSYLASQLQHHPMADPRATELLSRYQIYHPEADLELPQQTSHGIYWYNLHVVFVNEGRGLLINEEELAKLSSGIESVANKYRHRLSRAAIVQDHQHLTLGGNIQESPESVAFSYMNDLANSAGLGALFRFSYYVGTFSEYDLGVIPYASGGADAVRK